MEVVRMRLEIPPYAGARTRWNSTNNTFEIQLPNGSWVTDTTTDYRHAESGRLPIRAGTDKRCLAAANATKMLRDTIDGALATFNQIGVASAALGVGLAFIPELVSKGFAIAFGFASLALSIGSEILIQSFDQDAYDAIQCALYCAADGNGQWSAARLSTALDIIHSDPFVDDACDSITTFILGTLWGEVGTSNAGTMGKIASATCSGCTCTWTHTFDWQASSVLPTGTILTNLTWVSGVGYRVTGLSSPGHYDGYMTIPTTSAYGIEDAITLISAVNSSACARFLNSSDGGSAGGFNCGTGTLQLSNHFAETTGTITIYVGSLQPNSYTRYLILSGIGDDPYA